MIRKQYTLLYTITLLYSNHGNYDSMHMMLAPPTNSPLVTDDITLEAPLIPEYVCEEFLVSTSRYAVDPVVDGVMR